MRRSATRLSLVVAVLAAGLLAAGCGSSTSSSIGSLPSRTATVPGRPSVTAQPPTHGVTTAAPATGSAAPGASSGTSLIWLWVLLGVLVVASLIALIARISQVTRIPPQSVDPTVKNYHWLDLDLALLDAYDHDADLVVLRDLSGAIAEGPGYNVFAHLDGRWLTPGSGTLAGITRRSLIELARGAGQPVDEGRLTAEDLLRADEVLVTSTAGGIMPVTLIDGKPVGPGAPGPLTRQLRELYWASHQDPRYSTPVRYHEPG